jgi:hypothetical protein
VSSVTRAPLAVSEPRMRTIGNGSSNRGATSTMTDGGAVVPDETGDGLLTVVGDGL